MRILGGCSTEARSNRIPPNIAGYLDDGVVLPEDVIEVAEFPKCFVGLTFKLVGSSLFKVADEFESIRCRMDAFRENMHMVRHNAVGMD